MNNKPMDILHDIVVELKAIAIVTNDNGNYLTAAKLKNMATRIETIFLTENEEERNND